MATLGRARGGASLPVVVTAQSHHGSVALLGSFFPVPSAVHPLLPLQWQWQRRRLKRRRLSDGDGSDGDGNNSDSSDGDGSYGDSNDGDDSEGGSDGDDSEGEGNGGLMTARAMIVLVYFGVDARRPI